MHMLNKKNVMAVTTLSYRALQECPFIVSIGDFSLFFFIIKRNTVKVILWKLQLLYDY